MKKMLVVLMAILVMAGWAQKSEAQVDPYIGLFADREGTECSTGDFPFDATTEVYIVAHIYDIDGLTAAEFVVDGVDWDPAQVGVSVNWESPLTIGDIFGNYEFAIAFPEVQYGNGASNAVLLGTLSFHPLTQNAWPPEDASWEISPTKDHWWPPHEGNKLVIVDSAFEEITVDGGVFIANCTNNCLCDAVPTTPASWGGIKALY